MGREDGCVYNWLLPSKFGIYYLLYFHTLIIQAPRKGMSYDLGPRGPIVHTK